MRTPPPSPAQEPRVSRAARAFPFLALALALCLGAAALSPLPVQAQERITQEQVDQLADRTRAQREAYHRFDAAEREARAAGQTERATSFAQAKAKALESYTQLEAELKAAQARLKQVKAAAR